MSEHVSSTLKVTGVLYKSSERNSLVLYLGGENESSLLSEPGVARQEIYILLKAELLLFEEQSIAPARLSEVYS